MSTTKLTRKEISADPIHDALIRTVEIIRTRATLIIAAGIGLALLLVGLYFGMRYLESRESGAQREIAKGMDFYHGSVDANAKEDPYAFGPVPVFKSEEAKYRAAANVFGPIASRRGSSKLAVIGRYYLGLCQKQLGQKNEALATLESVANNSVDRTVGYLAKKVLATYYVELGDAKKGQEALQAILKDPQCDLPKEDIYVELSRAFMAQGKKEEALKTLQEAQESAGGGMLQSLVFQEMGRIQRAPGN